MVSTSALAMLETIALRTQGAGDGMGNLIDGSRRERIAKSTSAFMSIRPVPGSGSATSGEFFDGPDREVRRQMTTYTAHSRYLRWI